MSNRPYTGSAYLADYPADKVIVICDKCGLRVQYDKAALLHAGGDRALTWMLTEIARRNGCNRLETVSVYDRCGARYANLTLKVPEAEA